MPSLFLSQETFAVKAGLSGSGWSRKFY